MFESLLLIVVVVEAVWILSSLFRGSEEEHRAGQRRAPGPGRGEAPGSRPRAAQTNVDRFLEEINRRRREAAERQGGSPPRPAPAPERPRVAAPSSEAPRRPLVRVPVPVARTGPSTPPAPSPRRADRPRLATAERVEVVIAEVVPSPPAPAAAPSPKSPGEAFVPTVTSPGRLPGAGSASGYTRKRTVSAAAGELLPLLSDRKSIRTAFVLKEIFEPPLCRRDRHRRPAL